MKLGLVGQTTQKKGFAMSSSSEFRPRNACHFIALVGASMVISGCVPMVQSYYRTDYPNAKQFGTVCHGGQGTPAITYFPYNGIFVSVSVGVEKKDNIVFGFHVPAANRLQILQNSAYISYGTGGNVKTPALVPIPLRIGSDDPDEFRMVASPYGQEDYYGELVGETKSVRVFFTGEERVAYKTYLFRANFESAFGEAGKIVFPDLRINGQIFKGPTVTFKKSTDIGISEIC